MARFKLDVHGGARSRFNLSSALVFTEHYLTTNNLSDSEADAVTNAFLTRVKSIKQSFNTSDAQKAHKATYVRKYNVSSYSNSSAIPCWPCVRYSLRLTSPNQLYHRRLEAVAGHHLLQAHLPFLQSLSVDGMSSDEEDSVDVDAANSMSAPGPGTKVTVDNPTYYVLTPRWRSRELSVFLHVLDSVYTMQRRLDPERQRGNWPRPRVYDPVSPRLSKKTAFPKKLPRNAYDSEWFKRFQNPNLSLNPSPPYNFSHSPEVFQYVQALTST